MTLMDKVSPPEPTPEEVAFDDRHAQWKQEYEDVQMMSFCEEERWLQDNPEPVYDENPPNMFTEADDEDRPPLTGAAKFALETVVLMNQVVVEQIEGGGK